MVITGMPYIFVALATASPVIHLSGRVEALWLDIHVQNWLELELHVDSVLFITKL